MAVENLVWAIVAVFVCGLGGMIGLMAVMKDVFGTSNLGMIIAFSLLILTLMVAVEGVLITLLIRGRGRVRENDKGNLKKATTNELGTPQPLALRDPLPSVTEHTTRAFKPVFSERKAE